MNKLVMPFFFDFPHREGSWFVECGVWGWVLLLITFVLTLLGLYLLWKGCTARDVFLYFAIAGLLPLVGLHGTLYDHYVLGRLLGTADLPAHSLLDTLHEISVTGFLANDCYFFAMLIGLGLTLRCWLFSAKGSRVRIPSPDQATVPQADTQIYLLISGEQKGPYSQNEIQRLDSHIPLGDALYWYEGMADWAPVAILLRK